jgi:hypothetical protein
VDETAEPLPASRPGQSPDTAAPSATACLNCHAPLIGPFCADCGQRDIPPYPSVRELAVDAFAEVSGWDGRFATTIRSLVRHPGKLTREFLEGRRARYISPLRLYLVASLVYFVLAATAPDVRLDDGRAMYLGLRVTPTVSVDSTPSRAQRVGDAAGKAFDSQQPLDSAARDSVLAEISRAPRFMQPFLRRSITDPAGFKRGIFEAMPRMLFALLPVFAAIVALFYRGRKYPEHLYFAIHLHAFVFLALGLTELAKFTASPMLVGVIASISLLGIPVYATLAFRGNYGGSLSMALAKELAIAVLYAATCAIGFVTMIYWVSLFG